mgnify:CR=1 FL=1
MSTLELSLCRKKAVTLVGMARQDTTTVGAVQESQDKELGNIIMEL